jgi:molybdopterin-guanine dinucleotide biosynthesis protein
VLVEGFKRCGHPKLEVHRQERGTPLLAVEDPSIVALATDETLPEIALPQFPLDDVPAIADFVLQHAGPR